MPVRGGATAQRPLRPITRNISGASAGSAAARARKGNKKTFPGGFDVMKLKPLNDRVLVKRLESEEKTAGRRLVRLKAR